jgi:N-acetylmuramoyl-L-alanine amidase
MVDPTLAPENAARQRRTVLAATLTFLALGAAALAQQKGAVLDNLVESLPGRPEAARADKPAAVQPTQAIDPDRPLDGYRIGIDAGQGAETPLQNRTNLEKVDFWTRKLESEANLRVARILETYLERAGASTLMLAGRQDAAPRQRLGPAVDRGVDFVISLHHSYSVRPNENLTAAYYYPPENELYEIVARRVNESLAASLGIPGTGPMPAEHHMAGEGEAPTVVIVCSLLSNPDEFIHAMETPYNQRQAQAVARGLVNAAYERAGHLSRDKDGFSLAEAPEWRRGALGQASAPIYAPPPSGIAPLGPLATAALLEPQSIVDILTPRPGEAQTPAPATPVELPPPPPVTPILAAADLGLPPPRPPEQASERPQPSPLAPLTGSPLDIQKTRIDNTWGQLKPYEELDLASQAGRLPAPVPTLPPPLPPPSGAIEVPAPVVPPSPSLTAPGDGDALIPCPPLFGNPVYGPIDQTWLFGEQYETHPLKRGVSFNVPAGTPVRAVAHGVVVAVNYDALPAPSLPYARSVLIEHTEQIKGVTVYTMYGQMADVVVTQGQQLAAGTVLGRTGKPYDININDRSTEFEFEVRLGDKIADMAQNPELFIEHVPGGTGMIVGRLVNKDFRSLPGRRIDGARKSEVSHPYYSYSLTYAPDARSSSWQENFVIGDVPPGAYELRFPGAAPRAVNVQAGKVAYLTVVGQ